MTIVALREGIVKIGHSEKIKHAAKPAASRPRPVAVVDIGTTSVRMVIAQVDETGQVHPLETLSRAVNLGHDTFTNGTIKKSTIKESVTILQDYKRVLIEYEVTSPDQIRVVATSAVREARNRLAFLDRIYSATGIKVEPIDDAEVNRLTYLAIQSVLRIEPELAHGRVLVVEVGGGGTELLMLQDANVALWQSYRMGSLRLPEILKAYRAPTAQARSLLESNIRRTTDRIRREIVSDPELKLVALGGDARFAANQILERWTSAVASVPIEDLGQLAEHVMDCSADDLVREYRITYPEAETLGPALLAYTSIARVFGLESMLVSTANLRDGLLMEMAVASAFTAEFSNQIIRSALDLGRRFDFNEPHARHVAGLSRTIFQALNDQHELDPRFELILYVAALLHDIGNIVSSRSHHKHSAYLILNSDLFGLGERDLQMVAQVARYHRRAVPSASHTAYAALDMDSRIVVSKLAAMLRIADSIDRSESQRIPLIEGAVANNRFIISVPEIDDLSLEQLALQQKGTLFEDVFGMPIELRRAKA